MAENFETEAEREEREAVESGMWEQDHNVFVCTLCDGEGFINIYQTVDGVWDAEPCPACRELGVV